MWYRIPCVYIIHGVYLAPLGELHPGYIRMKLFHVTPLSSILDQVADDKDGEC